VRLGCGAIEDGEGVTVDIDSNYAATLAPVGAFDDCQLTMEELQSTPNGQALIAQLIQKQAEAYNVPASEVHITALHTDADQRTGCQYVNPGNNATGIMGGGVDVTLSEDYLNTLGPGSDCAIDPVNCGVIDQDEIRADPEAALLALNFQLAVCRNLEICNDGFVRPGEEAIDCNAENCVDVMITGININDEFTHVPCTEVCDPDYGGEAGSDPCISCSIMSIPGFEVPEGWETVETNEVGQNIGATVSAGFGEQLGDASAFEDCFLSEQEMASDPEAIIFRDQLIEAQAAISGMDPSDIVLEGIHTDGDASPCDDGNPCCNSAANGASGRRLSDAPAAVTNVYRYKDSRRMRLSPTYRLAGNRQVLYAEFERR
jgi:hypothetical protein